jgi:hypothetical protein
LSTDEFCFHVDFADERANVLSGFIPKCHSKLPLWWCLCHDLGVKYVTMTKQTASQWMELQIHSLIVRESCFLKLCLFWTRVNLPYFNKITLDHTQQDWPKTFYGRTISMHWNDQQGRLIYHQLSMCGTFLVNV